MKLNKKFIIMFLIIITVLFCFVLYLYKKDNLTFYVFFNKNKISKISEEEFVYLDNLGIGNITVTGLTYDNSDDTFWIADYDSNLNDNVVTPRIIETNTDFTEVKNVIDIDNSDGLNIQGISYSNNSDSLWIATGKNIMNISKTGEILNTISLDINNKCITNGLFYNDENDSIDVLCYEKYLYNIDKYGKINNKYHIDISNQDHITNYNSNLYLTVGANYVGKNYIFVYSDKYRLSKIFELKESYAIEGIVIKDDIIYVANDGVYHSAKIKKNYITKYKLK